MRKLSLVLFLTLAGGLVFVATNRAKGGTSTSVTATLPNLSSSPGLYNDGLGNYVNGMGANATIDPSGNFSLQPLCSTKRTSGRMMILVLPTGTFNSPISQCGPIFLDIPGVLGSTPGQVLGQTFTSLTTSAGTVFLYFLEDTDNDGIFSPTDDTHYNLKWQGGICVSSVTLNADKTTTYVLTTVAGGACATDLSIYAQLIRRTASGNVSVGYFTVPLTVTIIVPPVTP